MKQKQKEGDKYSIWKNKIREAFDKGTLPLDDLSSATNSLLKTKHLQSPFENNTEDFLNEYLPWVVSIILNSTVKNERFAKNILSFLSSVVKLIVLFIDYDENNNENATITIHNIWKFFNGTQVIFSQRNSNFYQCYQKLSQENPIDSYRSKIDNNFFTKIQQYFTNLANTSQISSNNQSNDNNSEVKSNLNDNTNSDFRLERIRTTISFILSFSYCYPYSNEIVENRRDAVQSILTYFFSLFVPKSNPNDSNDKNENTSCLLNLRTLNENLFSAILNIFNSVCTKELKDEFIRYELCICTIIANCQFLNKQFFAFKLIKEILSSSLKDIKECQILCDLQFIDRILKNSDLHEGLVKPFSEIFVKMMRNKLIKKKEHIQLYWNLITIKQHSSTIGPFLNGLETIILATKTGLSNYQINAKNPERILANQRIFDEEMTDALLESIIEKNVFPIEVIQFLGKGILILNLKQNRLIFDTLNDIYLKLTSNNNNNDNLADPNSSNDNNDNIKLSGKMSSNIFTEQETYINELIRTLCVLVPHNADDIEESCLKFIQNHDSKHLNYAISILQASIINNKITPEKADTYLNLLIDSINNTDLLNTSQYIQLLSNIILQLKKLHKKQFNTILNFTKSIFPINSSQFCSFYQNLFEQSTTKQFLSTKLIEKLFQETCSLCEDNSLFNEEIMNFLLLLYQKLDLKSNFDSENQNIKYIWNLLFKTNSEYASSFLLSVYKESASETAINDFINQCIQHINNYGSLKSLLSMISSFETEKDNKANNITELDIFSKPNLYICEEDDFYSVSFTGTVNTKLKMHFDSSYDDVCRKAALYLGTSSDEVSLHDPKTGKVINHSNFEIQNGSIYRVKKLLDKKAKTGKSGSKNKAEKATKTKIDPNLPSKILTESKEYSQLMFNALKSEDDLVASTAYKILNKIPPLKEFVCPILYLNVRQKLKEDEDESNESNEIKEKKKPEENENEIIEEEEEEKESEDQTNTENRSEENQPKTDNTTNNNTNNDTKNSTNNDTNNDTENSNNKDTNTSTKNTNNKNEDKNKATENTIYDYQRLHPDWSKSLNQTHKYLLLYLSNTIGNILRDQFDPGWISFFFETGGSFEYMRMSLSSGIESSPKISERDHLTILHVSALIVKEVRWKSLISSISPHFTKETIIEQTMSLTNPIQISLIIFLLQSVLTSSDISSFFRDNDENAFKLFVKKMLFHENFKIRKSMRNLISFIIESSKSKSELYEKQELFFTDLLSYAIQCEKSSDGFFSILSIFSAGPSNPLKIWKTTVQLLFEKFSIPETAEFIKKLTFKMASTDLAISLIILLSNIASYYSKNQDKTDLEELPEQEELLTFILNKVLFNCIKYYRLVNQLFELISFILTNKPTLTQIVVDKIKENQDQMAELLKTSADTSEYDFSVYQSDDNYSFNKFNFLSTNLKYRGIKNLGATCYINSTMQQLFSINEMKKIILDDSYSIDDWSGNLQLSFAQLLLYPTSYIDIAPFIRQWNGWDDMPIDPKQQQDAVEFLQMLFGRMEDKMPSFKSLFEGTFQYHFKSCNENVLYEKDTFDNFTMLSLEVKGMSCIEDSFRMFVQPEVFNDYKVEDFNGFTGKIDVEKYSMIKKAPEILIIQLKRFEYNLSTCTREKLNSKYLFDFEIDLAPIMIDQEEPVIYELFGIQMHSGSAQGGHYFSYIKYPREDTAFSSDGDKKKKFVWLKFNDVNVSPVDKSTLIDMCCGGNTIIDSDDEVDGMSTPPTIIENSSNAYLLYYRRKAKPEASTKTNSSMNPVDTDTNNDNDDANDTNADTGDGDGACSIDSIVANMNQELISNLSKDVKKLILSNIFSSEVFTSWIINNIIKFDQKGEILYYFILSSFKKATYTSKHRYYLSSTQHNEVENYVNVAVNAMNAQIASQKEAQSTASSDSLCSAFANHIIDQSNDIVYYLLVEDDVRIRQQYLRMLDKSIETSDLSVRVSLVAFLQTKVMDPTFCNSVLLKNWEHFDTFFQSFLSFPKYGYISGEWTNVLASFLFDAFVPYCESNEKGVIYANVDLSSFFTIFTSCQTIQNQKRIENSAGKSSKNTKVRASPSGNTTMSVITGNRSIDKEFVENFMLSQKQLHSFIRFLNEYPPFDINLTLNLKQSDIEQYNTSTLARYYILSVWFIGKTSDKLHKQIISAKPKSKDAERVKKNCINELTNKRNDAIKLNKMITDLLINGKRQERKVSSFLSTLSTLISFQSDLLLSAQSTIEFHSTFIHTLKPSTFYPPVSSMLISASNYNSLFNSYSTSSIITKFITSEPPSYRSLIFQFIKKLISIKESSNNMTQRDDTFCINSIEASELFMVLYSKIDSVTNLISKELNKLKREDFMQVNPSKDYFEILTKLAKIGDIKNKLVYYEVAKHLISLTKLLGQLTKKQPVIDCFNFIYESIGVENVDEFFTPIANKDKASKQAIDLIRNSSYREFLHGFDKFRSRNEYTKTNTTGNVIFGYGYSNYVSSNNYYKDDDDVYSYENDNIINNDDFSDEFVDFADFSDITSNYNSLRELSLRVISFVPSYGFDLFFESRFFSEIAGIQFLENKSNPNSGDSFTNMLLNRLNNNNVSNIVKSLFTKSIFDFYMKNYSQAYFRLINKVLKKFPIYATKCFIRSNGLYISILKQIKRYVDEDVQLKKDRKKSKTDSDSAYVSMLSKSLSLIIFSTISTKSSIYYRNTYSSSNKKIQKKKSEDDPNLTANYDEMKRKHTNLLNQHYLVLKDVYKSSLIENGNGLSYLLTAMSFLSEKSKDKAVRCILGKKGKDEKQRCYINNVPERARKSASFAISRICYRSFNLALFYHLLSFCNDLSRSSTIKRSFTSKQQNKQQSINIPAFLFAAIKEKVDEIKMNDIETIAKTSPSLVFAQTTFDVFDDDFTIANKKSSVSMKTSLTKIIDEINTSVDLDLFDVKIVGKNLMSGLFMILSLMKSVVDSLISVLTKLVKTSKSGLSQDQEISEFSTKKANVFISSLFESEKGEIDEIESETFSIHNLVVPTLNKIFSKSAEINDDQLFSGDFYRVVGLILLSKSSNFLSPFDFNVSKETAELWLNSAANLLSDRIKETLKNISINSIIQSRDVTINVFGFIENVISKFNEFNQQKIEWPTLNLTEGQIIELAKLFEGNQNEFCQEAAELLTRLMSACKLLPDEEI